ncbi:MAG: hypothetical protein WAK51_05655 [Opitutaceae bacterium]
MAGYSGTPLWKKLGYRDGTSARLDGGPKDYLPLLGLPRDVGVSWLDRSRQGMAFVHLFATSRAVLASKLASYRKAISADGVLWVSWPKKASGVETDITEDVIRKLALPMGFVDVKVCAVDDTWSGLKLVIRRELR